MNWHLSGLRVESPSQNYFTPVFRELCRLRSEMQPDFTLKSFTIFHKTSNKNILETMMSYGHQNHLFPIISTIGILPGFNTTIKDH